MNSNCSNLLALRNLQEQVKKAFCYQKLFWPFTVWINCSSDLKNFANSRPSASNFQSFSQSLEQFFLIVGQNNFGNKIPIPCLKLWPICNCFVWKVVGSTCHVSINEVTTALKPYFFFRVPNNHSSFFCYWYSLDCHCCKKSHLIMTIVRVSVQGVKSLGGHFACLCRGFVFYEVKKILLFFKKKREILLHF